MEHYNEQLEMLQCQIAGLRGEASKLDSLNTQQRELESKLCDLKRVMQLEQADVERLEGKSLTALYYRLTGQMEKRLDKERNEAYAAAVKYDAAVRELTYVKASIQEVKNSVMDLRDCERRYDSLLHEKKQVLTESGTQEGDEILHLEEQLAYLKSQNQEIWEAQSAGRKVKNLADSILKSLDSAESWGTLDLLGGGMLSDMAKHGHLDEAQQKVEHLQVQLRKFKTELADISVQEDMQVQVEGFLRFADYFFDGLFVDWTVLKRISASKEQVEKTHGEICDVLRKLDQLKDAVERQQKQTQIRMENLIRQARI